MKINIDLGFLTILFVILKLFGAIDWSWWWVFSPLWMGMILAIFFAAIIGIIHCSQDR